jgi:putative tricarboxylic transport membrane protein
MASNLVPLAIGLFGIVRSAVHGPAHRGRTEDPDPAQGTARLHADPRRGAPLGRADRRGTVLGFMVGLLPGRRRGASPRSSPTRSERKLSKHPEEFGKGAVEGLAGPEAANNAGTTGAFVPLLCMGIPANAITALLLGAFMIHGVAPGPTILERQPEMFWGVVASMYVGNIMLLILNLPLIGLFVRILDIPRACT